MRVSKNALLPYKAEQVFDLINDVASYPEFLDGCIAAEVLLSEDNLMEARLDLSKKGISQSFVTRNRLSPPHSIQMELVEGPLSSLNGEWTITPLGEDGCKLALDLEFEMKKGLIMQMIAKFFGEISNRLVDSISDEAARRFGSK